MDLAVWMIKSPFICVGWIIVGFIAGSLARQLMGSGNHSFISDIILGIVGAFVGGWLVGFFVDLPNGGLSALLVNIVVATIGASILIAIRRAIFGGRKAKA